MKHLVFIGPPVSGKGTLAKKLSNYTQISTGDLLRDEIKKNPDLGKRIDSLISEGKFLDDETMLDILKENVPKNKPLIFDGYPRNVNQIAYFESLVKEIDPNSDVTVVFFNIDLSKLEERIVNRLSCSGCGEIFNLKNKAPKKEDVCDLCGSELVKRKDDNEKAVKKRLNTYQAETFPVLKALKDKSYNIIELDANQDSEIVYNEFINKS